MNYCTVNPLMRKGLIRSGEIVILVEKTLMYSEEAFMAEKNGFPGLARDGPLPIGVTRT